MATIRFKRGPKGRLPKNALLGEPIYTTDTSELFIGRGPDSPIQKIGSETKDINIICSLPVEGIHSQYAKLPYDGTVEFVDAYCGVASNNPTEIDIEKISEEDFDNSVDNWTSILENNLVIDSDKRNHNKEYKLQDTKVNKNDLFRLVFVKAEGVEKLTVQIQVKLTN